MTKFELHEEGLAVALDLSEILRLFHWVSTVNAGLIAIEDTDLALTFISRSKRREELKLPKGLLPYLCLASSPAEEDGVTYVFKPDPFDVDVHILGLGFRLPQSFARQVVSMADRLSGSSLGKGLDIDSREQRVLNLLESLKSQ